MGDFETASWCAVIATAGHDTTAVVTALARLELTPFLRAFVRRVDSLEPAGEARRIHANLVGGFKALPVRIGLAH